MQSNQSKCRCSDHIFYRPLGDCKIHEYLLLDTTATGIRDDVTGEERVIVANNSKALSVCISCKHTVTRLWILSVVTEFSSAPSLSAAAGPELSPESQLIVVQISADRTSIIPLNADTTFMQVGSSGGLGAEELE